MGFVRRGDRVVWLRLVRHHLLANLYVSLTTECPLAKKQAADAVVKSAVFLINRAQNKSFVLFDVYQQSLCDLNNKNDSKYIKVCST